MTETPLKQRLQAYLQAGQQAAARALCEHTLKAEPENLLCLSFLAQQAFMAGDLQEAESYLQRALAIRPEAPTLRQNMGMLYQQKRQHQTAAREFLLGLKALPDEQVAGEMALRLADALRHVDKVLAGRLLAWLFAQQPALAQAWQLPQAPAAIRELSASNGQFLARHRFESQWHVAQEFLSDSTESAGRVRLFLEYFHGLRPVQWAHPLQRPSYHFFPGLRAQPFYDMDEPWQMALRADWEKVREEKNAILQTRTGIKPYVDEKTPDDPDWKKLEKNLQWTSAHLLKGGEVNAEVASRCPHTMQVLQKLPLVRMAEHAPEAFFSILRPDTYIPPHFGLSNLKLTVHLGLDIPADCAIEVGRERRGWAPGEILVFDDSFRHAAWNRSQAERAVLITEIWHPDLRLEEQQALSAIMQEQAAYQHALQQVQWPQLLADMMAVVLEPAGEPVGELKHRQQ